MSNKRCNEILRLINSEGSMSVGELAKRVYASPSTVRRDLESLERQNLIRRHHGGAESVMSLRPPQIIRRQLNTKEKNSIAQRAAELVTPDSTIFIDGSTTVQYMIPYLASVSGLTVYTNGVDTVMRLSEARIRAICTGGDLLTESLACVGSVAADTVRRVRFDAMFFSSAGYNDEFISDWSEDETILRRAVIEQSAARYFLADHTKKGKQFTHIVCKLSAVDKVICD